MNSINKKIKIAMVSLGCPKNQVDAEMLLANLGKNDFEITVNLNDCDAVIINTCGFIESAKQESIENILECCELKKENKLKCVVVTGCLAQRYHKDIKEEIPEVDVCLGIGNNSQISLVIKEYFDNLKNKKQEKIFKKSNVCELPLEGERMLSTPQFYAYLKIAEGCDNCCSYCAIPSIRGPFRSREKENIIKEAKALANNGVKELIIIAQDTTRYGEDLYGQSKLPELLEELCKIDSLKWIRVLYCYPERISDQLIDVISSQEKIVKYLDIPIQHCNDDILHKMNRKSNRKQLDILFKKLKEKCPEIIIRTTLIAGFPTESENQFENMLEFVRDYKFERLGCFAYSAEEGTKAAQMEDQIDLEIKQSRADMIMEKQFDIMSAFNQKQIGKTFEVVCEGFDKISECYYGRSYMDAPDIDGKIFFTSENTIKQGDFVNVEINDVLDYDLIGKTVLV
ncbi:MAG: 30S ribosomal protein S12 methylthiotransferase RimO [Oscillospiraceae bacterium]